MDALSDLDRIDRATLRAWRISNLVGWWAVGVIVYYGVGLLLSRTFVQKVAYETVGWPAVGAGIVASAFAAATTGSIVGSRVYRSPGSVAALAIVFPGGAAAVLLALLSGQVASVLLVLIIGAQTAIAATTSRAVWRRRPRALRLDPSR